MISQREACKFLLPSAQPVLFLLRWCCPRLLACHRTCLFVCVRAHVCTTMCSCLHHRFPLLQTFSCSFSHSCSASSPLLPSPTSTSIISSGFILWAPVSWHQSPGKETGHPSFPWLWPSKLGAGCVCKATSILGLKVVPPPPSRSAKEARVDHALVL